MARAYTEKRKASNAKWDAANLKRLSLAVKIEIYDRMKSRIDETGESMNGFITAAILEKLDKDSK